MTREYFKRKSKRGKRGCFVFLFTNSLNHHTTSHIYVLSFRGHMISVCVNVCTQLPPLMIFVLLVDAVLNTLQYNNKDDEDVDMESSTHKGRSNKLLHAGCITSFAFLFLFSLSRNCRNELCQDINQRGARPWSLASGVHIHAFWSTCKH